MAGHNKWSNIKNRKGAQDKRRSKAFFEVGKMIRSAVKDSQNGDPDTNPALRLAVDKARSVNMPKETVQRAIDRALGKSETGESIQEVTYEGYGPHGVGFLVITATDNVQRTAGNIRFAFSRNGGSLGGPGSVMYLFKREGADFVSNMMLDLSPEQGKEVQALYDALVEDEDVEEVYMNARWEGMES
ncbi:YebC/PmpR family DNA-binding transcriptional regulator [Candidatus Woesebacteria bacterium]|nr:YebC/PmpR family DNA-binding transcriptional regulator [Candidatus Woesebacteria bacterium]MCD8527163.1 YebC/PmpR family DNA-binding transcriptional regulator [Candidatus Woesebacteria bacterium]MCD8546800.1 YebC/PmpR family DNA-binding transcriptional regulator [Candidatus Woesebacteria bacterium]